MITILAGIIFIVGYIFITLEHKFHTHKSAVALALASILWILVAASGVSREFLHEHLAEAGTEVFSIMMFLLAAMTLVEILVHYNFFDIIRIRLAHLGLDNQKLFAVLGTLTFFLSAVLDNLTITIVMIQIARKFFKDANLLIVAGGVVILANAGGAWSPIGDVTTIMIWLAGKFGAFDIIREGFLPAAALALTSGFMLMKQISNNKPEKSSSEKILLTRGEKAVIGISLASFTFPLLMNGIGLEPYFGLLFGLGIVWTLIEYIKVRSQKYTHLEANIEHLLQKTDISSLKFFAGILLSVSALSALGFLDMLSDILFGANQEISRVIIGNIILGGLSSIVDNVPLTALAIDIIKVTDVPIWTLLALTVGTGGSFLVIGSVAGVVAMGMVKGLTFDKYLKYATAPAVVGYAVAMGIWFVQYQFIK
ncbi:sodium:proton antiporter NhaD [Candidatus Woesebacteria bacterium]|nr:sodium:proton antiporter NhaD [Candidatus Woesebacteria bacterium]